MKFIFIFLIFFSFLSGDNSESNQMIVHLYDDSILTYGIENIENIDFIDITSIEGQFKISFKDEQTVSIEIENIEKITFSEITNVEDKIKLMGVINAFTLLQNYPNPFNPVTTIEYEIPKECNVNISVYDLNGRLVKNLYDGKQSVGNHKLNWDGINNHGKSVANGLYIYTIQFDDKILSKKMIYLK